MPTQVIQYQCNKCFQTYLNEQTAIDCESKHFELNDFTIINISRRTGIKSKLFPDFIHVANKNTNKVAFYDLCHDEVIKSVKQEWLDRLDKTYNFPSSYGYRFDSGLFPSEGEDE